MEVLIGCEYSGVLCKSFRKLGVNAWSCDLLRSEYPDYHLQKDIFVAAMDNEWTALFCFPDCTYLCSSGLHWNKRVPGRAAKTEDALEFVRRLLSLPIKHILLENSVGCIGTRIGVTRDGEYYKTPEPRDLVPAYHRLPYQIIQPYDFGDDASKATCLYRKNLPELIIPDGKRVVGRQVEWPPNSGKIKERWANQTDSGQNALPPSQDRWKIRARTYPGIADAIAKQYTEYLHGLYS